MPTYVKKSIVIEAFCLGIDNIPDWFMNKVTSNEVILHAKYNYPRQLISAEIKTLKGVMTVNRGDFIIQGLNGEIYPCKPDIFEKTYNLVEAHNVNVPK